ncbi:phosphogluconate dehydratase [Amylibacter marinus]|uniref:Phosphogluconate dehydratase n=1 Tax=Amylibacter marinus TaxID=1475483 RepID=A0ABQ5VT12_9RHOB|nr:phosphogluconate dehydratase [Amylibacter marinus]GLQ34294.1 phosphogluconate dehydratase [Amylibacter marinus]
MALNKVISDVTDAIIQRSEKSRRAYLDRMEAARGEGPNRAHLTCGNQAHAYAPMGQDKDTLVEATAGNVGIITSYNDMLSAHQPFSTYPDLIKEVVRQNGGTAQVAAGVPAMCDGVTQGQTGMELSLFSRDAIAMSAGIGLSHNVFDSSIYLGVCDKIVPGLVIAAATFGHLPAVFMSAGPMPSGITNDEKARVRKEFAQGNVGREELMAAEMASYHGPGTCTFYGTANTNQMLMEIMGLQLPGSSFVNPGTDLRTALTKEGAKLALSITDLGNKYTPVSRILDERAYVNGIVGLMATGGSTNLLIHILAMARASGIILDWDDFAKVSEVIPLLTKVYPNGLADVNHFHAAGGLGLVIRELLNAGLVHDDTTTILGKGLEDFTKDPILDGASVTWRQGPQKSLNNKIVSSVENPFQASGGLASLNGNLGKGVMKISAVAPERRSLTAPVRIFHDQPSVIAAFRANEFTKDVVVVVRYQGPQSNGMPELHGLTPCLTVLQDRGINLALVTDGRMSGASGKVPAVIHVSPEASQGGPLAFLKDGDIVTVNANTGEMFAHDETFFTRDVDHPDLSGNEFGVGRELFNVFRNAVGRADTGASIFEF